MNNRIISLLTCAAVVLSTVTACTPAPSDTAVTTTTKMENVTATTTKTTAGTTTKPTTTQQVTVATGGVTTIKTVDTAKTTVTTTTKKTTQIAVNGLPLVVGKQSSYTIIIGANATPSEKAAAKELRSYLSSITGCRLSLETDARSPSANEIVVGKTNREKSGDFNRDELGTDGFIIKTADKKLYLVGGGDRGTLYAVYEFLEAYLGCRFYTLGVEKVPKTDTVALAPIKEDKQIPVFEYRCVYGGEYRASESLAVKRKLSGTLNDDFISEERGGSISFADKQYAHTYTKLVSPDKYFASHPEYFRLNQSGARDTVSICVTNPDVLNIIVDGVKKSLRENPNAELIAVSQMDVSDGGCYCENCKKLDTEAGSHAGSVIYLANAVARAIKNEFPAVRVMTHAYLYTRTAPQNVTFEDNVVVQFAPIEQCGSHPYTDNCGQAIRGDLTAWSQLTNLYIWDYTTDFAHYNLTFPNLNSLRENIRFYAENKVIGVLNQGAYQSISGEFGELRSYLLSKCLWDPYMTEEEYNAHMNDFLEGVYGNGWRYIREFIDYAHELTKDKHFGIFVSVEELFYPSFIKSDSNRSLPTDLTMDNIRNYTTTDWEPYVNWYTQVTPNTLITRGEELFAKALAEAETEQQRKHLDRAFIQVEYLRSFYYYHLYTEFVRTDMETLITNFLKQTSSLTEEEIADYADNISRHVESICADKYLAYNTALRNKLYDYKIHLREGDLEAQFLLQDLSLPPSRWGA